MGARVRRFPLPPLPDDSPVKTQLDRILASRIFRSARRSQLFLRYILHHAVARPDEPLKEYSVAIDVFDRDTSYDPAVNNTVRVEAGRLRSRLCEYYAGEGHADPLVIEIPKGSYRAFIQVRESGRVPVTEPVPVPRPSPAAPLAAPAPGTPAPRQLRFLWAVPLAFLSACLSAIASY
jgi:hypothetical protein